jgi:hypothetical protein
MRTTKDCRRLGWARGPTRSAPEVVAGGGVVGVEVGQGASYTYRYREPTPQAAAHGRGCHLTGQGKSTTRRAGARGGLLLSSVLAPSSTPRAVARSGGGGCWVIRC